MRRTIWKRGFHTMTTYRPRRTKISQGGLKREWRIFEFKPGSAPAELGELHRRINGVTADSKIEKRVDVYIPGLGPNMSAFTSVKVRGSSEDTPEDLFQKMIDAGNDAAKLPVEVKRRCTDELGTSVQLWDKWKTKTVTDEDGNKTKVPLALKDVAEFQQKPVNIEDLSVVLVSKQRRKVTTHDDDIKDKAAQYGFPLVKNSKGKLRGVSVESATVTVMYFPHGAWKNYPNGAALVAEDVSSLGVEQTTKHEGIDAHELVVRALANEVADTPGDGGGGGNKKESVPGIDPSRLRIGSGVVASYAELACDMFRQGEEIAAASSSN